VEDLARVSFKKAPLYIGVDDGRTKVLVTLPTCNPVKFAFAVADVLTMKVPLQSSSMYTFCKYLDFHLLCIA
jgi:hypothetical protein